MTSTVDAPLMSLPLAPLRRGLGLVFRALRRHWWQIVLLTLAFTAAAATAARLMPRTYSGEQRVLSRKNFLMPALADPRRAVPFGAEAPSQAASELVLQRTTLERIMRDAKLVERWEGDRAWILRTKDALRTRLLGAVPREEQEDAILELLRTRLRVQVQEEVITIRVSWYSAAAVVDIVNAAYRGFQAERERLDVESIEATGVILEERLAATNQLVEQRLVELRVARSRASALAKASVAERQKTLAVNTVPEKEENVSEYTARLMRARREERRAALEVELAEQAGSLGEAHPDRIALRDAIASLKSSDSLDAKGASPWSNSGTAAKRKAVSSNSSLMASALLEPDDPDQDVDVAYARAMLRVAVDTYEDLSMRAGNARIEASTARAAAPFRYTLTSPVRRPRKPDSPNVVMLVLGGLVVGMMAGVLMAIATEVRSRAGTWQHAPSYLAHLMTQDDAAWVMA
jgi:uncharacterized protein involved in exopolysaccharide biosynthesis